MQSRLPRYEQLSLQALKAARSRDIEAEIAARQQLVSEFPRANFGPRYPGRLPLRCRQAEQSLEVLQQGLALDPKNEDLLNFQCYELAQWGDFNGALAASDAYMAVRPG